MTIDELDALHAELTLGAADIQEIVNLFDTIAAIGICPTSIYRVPLARAPRHPRIPDSILTAVWERDTLTVVASSNSHTNIPGWRIDIPRWDPTEECPLGQKCFGAERHRPGHVHSSSSLPPWVYFDGEPDCIVEMQGVLARTLARCPA